MVAMYTVFGRQVGSHVLSMATLGTTFATAAFFLSGGKEKAQGPPINAKDKEEENFVKDFIAKNADKEKH